MRAPLPRRQAAPKHFIRSLGAAHSAGAVIGGRVAKTTGMETVYQRGWAVKVTAAMKDTRESENLAPELRVWC